MPGLRRAVESVLCGRSKAGRRRRRPHIPQASARGPRANGAAATAAKAWWDCKTAPHGRIVCAARRLKTVVDRIEALRREHMPGKHIAKAVGVSPATVSRVLKRLGLSSLKALEPAEPVRRYEREQPGELIHIDIKKLGRFNRIGHRITGDRRKGDSRGAGHEFVHVAIDDASRLAFSRIHPDEKKESAIAFLDAAVAYYRSLGVRVVGIMTDNGSCYRAKAFARACRRLGLSNIFTRPYRPQTNGKAERFSQTALREWAYARAYDTSDQRAIEPPSGSTTTTGTVPMVA